MVVMINGLTGSSMTVADERVDEYLAAGHKLAVETPTEQKPKKEAAKKATTKKTSKK